MSRYGNQSVDLVFTWVDGTWPGFESEAAQFAKTRSDLAPNRTRDNLSILRYALRSIEKYAPWRRIVYIVTCRPQCPTWLDLSHPDLRLVHHDEFIPTDYLPTFNSFAIQSFLHCIPGVSARFVSMDDDMLCMSMTCLDDFVDRSGDIRYQFSRYLPHRNIRASDSPWTAALVNNAYLLDRLVPGNRWPGYAHCPKMFDIRDCAEIIELCPEQFETTRRSRFRAPDNVAIEALLPQFLVAGGRAVAARQQALYLGLEDFTPWNSFWLWLLRRRETKFLTLNDNFGAVPNPRAVRAARRFLENLFPDPSSYEITD